MTIDTTYIDSDADHILPARPAILAAVTLCNDLAASSGASLVGFDFTETYFSGTLGALLQSYAVNIKAYPWLAKGDGSTNDAVAYQAALNYSIANDKSLYLPAGVFILGGGVGLTNDRIEPTIANGKSIVIFGEGPGKTIVREKAGDTLAYGKFHMMQYFNVGAGVTVDNIIIRDITFDKNGASNGAEPTAYAWEQAHIISIAVDTTSGLVHNVLIDNVELLDKVGGGVVLASGRIENAIIRNTHGRNFAGLVSQRGDFEWQATVKNLQLVGCTGPFAQCEPNAAAPDAGVFPIASFRDCVIDNLQFTSFTGSASAVIAQTVILDNTVAAAMLTVRNAKLLAANNSKFQVGDGASEYWQRLAPGSMVKDCTVTVKYDSATNTLKPFYPKSEATLGGFYLTFDNCIIKPGDGASGTTTGPAIFNVNVYVGTYPYKVVFIECQFDPLFQQTIDAYRAGNYEFIRCKMAGWGTQAVRVGAATTSIGSVILDSCDWSQVTATYKCFYTNSNALWSCLWRGVHAYSDAALYSYSSITNLDLYVKFEGRLTSTTIPAAGGINGMIVGIQYPTYGNAAEYACTVTHATSATFRMSKQFGVKKDTTANRPTLTASDIDARHLDTTLAAAGKPIAWTGTVWVDSTGAAV